MNDQIFIVKYIDELGDQVISFLKESIKVNSNKVARLIKDEHVPPSILAVTLVSFALREAQHMIINSLNYDERILLSKIMKNYEK